MAILVAFPPPDTVAGYFALFQDSWLLCLLSLDLLYLLSNVLFSVLQPALYPVLRRTSESFMDIALNPGAAYGNSGDTAAASRALAEAIMLSRAAETHREALQMANESGNRPVPFAGMAYVGLADALCEWNDLDNARRHVLEGTAA